MSTPLNDPAVMLIRQVHPTQVDADGTPTRTAFTPTSRDRGKLSTLHGRVGPGQAYDRHVGAGYQSSGSWHFSVEEASDLDLPAVEDGEEAGLDDHVSVDFAAHESPSTVRQTARKLRAAAVDHGCQHP